MADSRLISFLAQVLIVESLQFERLEEILDRNLWWQLLWAMLFEIMAQVDIRILLVIR